MNKLICALKRDEDEFELAELSIEISHKSFSGKGCCYVSVLKLKDILTTFKIYPLPMGGTAAIEGGYFIDDVISPDETHLHISAVPFGRLGQLQLKVLLSSQVDEKQKDDLMKLECKILISYEQLGKLTNGLTALSEGAIGDFEVLL